MAHSQVLSAAGIAEDQLPALNLSVGLLEAIHADFVSRAQTLDDAAEILSRRLARAPKVHSTRARVKDPLHLLRKIVRKRADDPGREFSVQNYTSEITDLIGGRALHLYKRDWEFIHDYVMDSRNFAVSETPVANIRLGDPQDAFVAKGCDVRVHKAGYRSVHYIIKNLAHNVPPVEIQVRTLIEEAWSEIDHQVRYPEGATDAMLAGYLNLFNGFAGNADAMAEFVQQLGEYIRSIDHERRTLMEELKATVQGMEHAKKEKAGLLAKVKALEESLASSRQEAVPLYNNLMTFGAGQPWDPTKPHDPYLVTKGLLEPRPFEPVLIAATGSPNYTLSTGLTEATNLLERMRQGLGPTLPLTVVPSSQQQRQTPPPPASKKAKLPKK